MMVFLMPNVMRNGERWCETAALRNVVASYPNGNISINKESLPTKVPITADGDLFMKFISSHVNNKARVTSIS